MGKKSYLVDATVGQFSDLSEFCGKIYFGGYESALQRLSLEPASRIAGKWAEGEESLPTLALRKVDNIMRRLQGGGRITVRERRFLENYRRHGPIYYPMDQPAIKMVNRVFRKVAAALAAYSSGGTKLFLIILAVFALAGIASAQGLSVVAPHLALPLLAVIPFIFFALGMIRQDNGIPTSADTDSQNNPDPISTQSGQGCIPSKKAMPMRAGITELQRLIAKKIEEKKGKAVTLMIDGASSVGKTTFVEQLALRDAEVAVIYRDKVFVRRYDFQLEIVWTQISWSKIRKQVIQLAHDEKVKLIVFEGYRAFRLDIDFDFKVKMFADEDTRRSNIRRRKHSYGKLRDCESQPDDYYDLILDNSIAFRLGPAERVDLLAVSEQPAPAAHASSFAGRQGGKDGSPDGSGNDENVVIE